MTTPRLATKYTKRSPRPLVPKAPPATVLDPRGLVLAWPATAIPINLPQKIIGPWSPSQHRLLINNWQGPVYSFSEVRSLRMSIDNSASAKYRFDRPEDLPPASAWETMASTIFASKVLENLQAQLMATDGAYLLGIGTITPPVMHQDRLITHADVVVITPGAMAGFEVFGF